MSLTLTAMIGFDFLRRISLPLRANRTSDRSIPLQPAQLRTGRLTATLNLHQH